MFNARVEAMDFIVGKLWNGAVEGAPNPFHVWVLLHKIYENLTFKSVDFGAFFTAIESLVLAKKLLSIINF